SRRDGNYEIYTINDDGSDLKRLTSNKLDDIKPQWSPDGTKIMYLTKNRKQYAIRVMNGDGSGQVELTDNCVGEYPPLWSPDSSKILFVAKIKSENAICTVDADGGNLTRLTEVGAEGTFPSWSPDGSRILYLEKYRKDAYIYSMKPDGTERMKITREKGSYRAPTWSPDGRKIAYFSTKKTLFGTYNQIQIINSDGGNPMTICDCSKRLEDIDYHDEYFWSPDGITIALTKVADIEAHYSDSGSVSFSYNYGAYIVKTDGNDHDRLLAKIGAEPLPPVWSPDSSKIACLYSSKLLIYNLKTKIDNEIKTNVSIPLSPAKWSPDGKKVIFAGKNHSFQKAGLYLVTLDGKVTKLSEANDYDPVWAPK
ncbi:MAG: hypothetical protein GX075_06935, partial [Firmicutes bacterium]|nr:hypothetical protein [Bacillota bacterium]